MVWEHKHIANEKLEAKFENDREGVTLRQLLKLDILPGVPKTWPDDDLRLFLDRGLPGELERAVEIHDGEAGVRHVLPEACRPTTGTRPTASTPSSGCKIKVED